MLFSRFAHRISKGDTVAYFNSLRLRPVFVDKEISSALDLAFLIPSKHDYPPYTDQEYNRQNLDDAIHALYQAKVLVETPEYDDRVLDYVLSTIQPAYIQIAYFILSDFCNFGCKYCFIRNDMPSSYNQQHMTIDIAVKGLDMFAALIARTPSRFEEQKSIIFYGGEPLLNKSVLKVLIEKIGELKRAKRLPEKLQTSIVTNGSLITSELATFFKDHNISVCISLDGNAEATDSCRCYVDGRPVFLDVMKAIDICKQAKVNISLSVTLTEKSILEFDTTLKTLLDISPNGIGFNMIFASRNFPVPEWYNEKASACMLRAFDEFRRRGIPEDRIMRKAKAFAESRIYPFDCGASGGNQIVVAPDGQVGICHGYLQERKYFVTTVDDKDFNPQSNPVYQEWEKRTPLLMPECQSCSALGICGGGCPMQAEKTNGSILHLDFRFCVHAKTTLEWLIWDVLKTIQQ